MKWLGVLLLVVAIAWWLSGSDLERQDLGPGAGLVARSGVDVILVRSEEGGWSALRASAQSSDEAVALPPLLGQPWLDGRGRVVCLAPEGLLRLTLEAATGQIVSEDLEFPEEPDGWQLRGIDGDDRPVLSSSVGPGVMVHVGGAWKLLAPDLALPIVVSDAGQALAFLGEEGWEAWLYAQDPPVRRVAAGCRGPQAVFTPDGTALVTDGRTDGLWRLELDREAQGHMAVGNLGTSARVPWSCGFRGDPLMLVAPQWDIQGSLQLQQTHLSGGGRWRFSSGYTQHYAPVVSHDGRHMAYVQAVFERGGSEPFEEQLFLFDFDHPQSAAVSLGSRPGGLAGQGPAFVGTGSVLVWIADGRVNKVQRSPR